MPLSATLDRLHAQSRHNRWMRYFTTFVRIALAAGFLPSGFVKITGERFTALSSQHPMGQYLDALFATGWYYTFIGVMQVTAAILLLIPRTVTLGAMIYFPIIVNICLLSLAVRFDGSLLSSPFMVLANLYLLCWDYHKWKLVLPFNHKAAAQALPPAESMSNRFPIRFFAGAFATILLVAFSIHAAYNMRSRNTLPECREHCQENNRPTACLDYCDCIHIQGRPHHKCLEEYEQAVKKQ